MRFNVRFWPKAEIQHESKSIGAALKWAPSVFAGQTVGVREVDDKIWLVSFLEYDLGCFDKEKDRVEPGPNHSLRRKC